MKLSEAIRLGAMMKPQAFGDLIGAHGGTCALMAALEAAGIPQTQYEGTGRVSNGREQVASPRLVWVIPAEWRSVMHAKHATCPECGSDQVYIGYLIPHLNDAHYWTREQIADFVESIEKQQRVSVESAMEERVLG